MLWGKIWWSLTIINNFSFSCLISPEIKNYNFFFSSSFFAIGAWEGSVIVNKY